MPELQIAPGLLAVDDEADEDGDDEVLVIDVLDEPADEVVITYDYKMNPVTVADFNEEYGCDPDDDVAVVVYVESLDRDWPYWEQKDVGFVTRLTEEEGLKAYRFPFERLSPHRMAFGE